MTARRIATAIATTFVVICVALAVPISQLRMRTVVTQCCCPDPTKCHCPDHDPGDDTSMRACHKSQQVLASVEAPAFSAPKLPIAMPVADAPVVIAFELASPKAPPSPAPPYGPS